MNLELKPCPFCGKVPHMEKIPLWNGSHGYHGCYKYDIYCEKCGCCVNLGRNDTINNKDKKARQNAINAWNRRAKGEQINSLAPLPCRSEKFKR